MLISIQVQLLCKLYVSFCCERELFFVVRDNRFSSPHLSKINDMAFPVKILHLLSFKLLFSIFCYFFNIVVRNNFFSTSVRKGSFNLILFFCSVLLFMPRLCELAVCKLTFPSG